MMNLFLSWLQVNGQRQTTWECGSEAGTQYIILEAVDCFDVVVVLLLLFENPLIIRTYIFPY